MYASRNIVLCTKDCLCLFVCPTGATDTETGQIDKNLCIDGCRLCVDACPSHAIYLVQQNYPEPKPKEAELAEMLFNLLEQKSNQEGIAEQIQQNTDNLMEKKLAKALKESCRIVAEDCAREAGYMLPQSRKVRDLLLELSSDSDNEVKEIVRKLL